MGSGHGTELVQGAIYEFHKPDPGQRIEVKIVFMHGLQVKAADLKDAYFKTWRTADGNTVWPETWLKEKYPNARILSLAYDSSARQNRVAGNMGSYLLGESLLHQMVSTAGNIGQNDCPVVFVGHSLGGLIAKEIVVRCHMDRANVKYQNLLRNLKAVFFYATPHGGSCLTKWADSSIAKIARWLGVKTSSLVEYLKPEGTDRTHIHHDFLRAVNKDCKFYVVAEGRETEFMKGFKKWIVDENSARFPGPHSFVMLKDADHMTVCKPQSTNDTGYLKLIDCIHQVIEDYKGKITVYLALDPIDIEGKINDISELLERPEVSIVGLFGMGGIGKTTLSKAFYNDNAFKYAKSCYLEKVASKKVEDVQKELLRGLCGEQLDQNERVKKQHLDTIKDCLLREKVLVVIDDVNSEECLRDLQVFHALDTQSQSSQSKVVVTSRDSAILPNKYSNSGKAKYSVRKDVKGISKVSDLELFLRYALDAIPDEDKEKAKAELLGEATKIVQLCNGLPLSLEVLGKYLGNSKDEGEDLQQWKETWIDAYERLRKAQSIDGNNFDKLWSSLRICYDHLDGLEKQMFLDFACIFSNYRMKKKRVERIWGSPIGVKNLVNRSLLKEEGGRYVMHDQLRDMGRHVLLKEALEDYQRPIYLIDDRFPPFVEFQKFSTDSGVPYNAKIRQEVEKSLRKYSKLRFFIADMYGAPSSCPSLVDDCLSQCSGDLRWLSLSFCSGVTKLGIQKLCLFGGLHVLEMWGCNIEDLPNDIGKLINLVELKVIGSRFLQSLPDTIGELKNLKRLAIEDCEVLQALPNSVGELSEVEHLSFRGCHQLTVIHGTQICTRKLKKLKLPIIPTTCLCPCPQLRRLDIENRRQGVKEFPQDFFKIDMPKLEVVEIVLLAREFVLKNPDGSKLVLKVDIHIFEVHRQHDGSISRLSLK